VPHSAGPALADRIAEERRRRAGPGLPDVGHMTALLEQMVASGTTRIRTHTDVVTDHGPAGVHAVRAARERLGGRVTIEQVAFPQYGVLAGPGTAGLLEEALRSGAEVIGGIDGIRDLWSPFGSSDMLERAMHLAYRSTFRRDEEIELAPEAATYGGARALGLQAQASSPARGPTS
jgi:cytosine/creatinine deaminase